MTAFEKAWGVLKEWDANVDDANLRREYIRELIGFPNPIVDEGEKTYAVYGIEYNSYQGKQDAPTYMIIDGTNWRAMSKEEIRENLRLAIEDEVGVSPLSFSYHEIGDLQ